MNASGNDEQSTCVGIDLGTTNSLVAHVGTDGDVQLLMLGSESFLPSVVGLDRGPRNEGAGKLLVGRPALNNARRDPRNTIRSIKRFMGMPFQEPKVQVARSRVVYEVVQDPSRGGALAARIGDQLLTPEDVSAQILLRLKQEAEKRLRRSVTHAVITVPAYFLESQRAATRRAGELAGLKVKALLDEPTAAALSEGGRDRSRMLVFDFGGGTLDISVVQRSGGNISAIEYAGDNHLGGDDIDRGLAQLIRKWASEQGADIRPDNYELQWHILQQAEDVKKNLSLESSAEVVHLPNVKGELWIDQESFANVLAPISQRIRDLFKELFTKSSLQPRDFTEVLMVGGTSAVPAFFHLLQEIFEADGTPRVRVSRCPMEAVARGAALYGSMIKGVVCSKGHPNDMETTSCAQCGESLTLARFDFDKTQSGGEVSSRLPRAIGVRYESGEDDDCFAKPLKKGDLYPTPSDRPAEEKFIVPGREFAIYVYEGDSSKASANDSIKVIRVDDLPDGVSPGDTLLARFWYQRDRTLEIQLVFPTSKREAKLKYRVEPTDRPAEDPNSPIQVATAFLPKVRNFLQEYDEFMPTGERMKLEDDIEEAGDAVNSDNVKEAQRLTEAMQAAVLHGSSVASTLFLAESTAVRDDPAMGGMIQRLAQDLRQRFHNKEPTETTRRALQDLVHSAFRKLTSGHRRDSDLLRLPTLKR